MKIGKYINPKFKDLIKESSVYQKLKFKNTNEHTYYFYNISKTNQYKNLFENAEILPIEHGKFISWIDVNKEPVNLKMVIGNIPPKYDLILNNSIDQLIDVNSNGNSINEQNKELLLVLKEYILRSIEYIKQSDLKNKEFQIQCFENMITRSASSLDDALQRILFWSSLFWQTGHKLVGLGRLDLILDSYISKEESNEQYVKDIIDFLECLHDYYNYKSNALKGDIGQIIIVGGLDEQDHYFYNALTYSFIEATKKIKLPDPKVLLRVAEGMPDDLIRKATESISTGIGSPILANDDVVIPSLQKFGYKKKDAYNYAVSACWEPLSYGNSLEQNNLANINFAKCISESFKDDAFISCQNFDDYMVLYNHYLKREISNVLSTISNIRWENDPLYTLFTDGCIQNDQDISAGGAIYNDYGILSVGLGNTVNSLFNIKKYVFEEKKYSTASINNIWINGNNGNQIELDKVLNENCHFGKDDTEVIQMTNLLISEAKSIIFPYRNKFGGRIKFGLSSPNYLTCGEENEATFDGRKTGEPYSTHISSDGNVAYTELISFASNLDYSGCSSNGNVVDFFVNSGLLINNFDKFVQFIKYSIKQGFFEMQMNVTSSDILIDAKEHPDKHKDLIVRVWGFSAYFNDLPIDYKDTLINRAIKAEGK
jgi:formate C-acetyltransferase